MPIKYTVLNLVISIVLLNLVLRILNFSIYKIKKGAKKEPAAHAIPPWSPTGVLSMPEGLIRGAWGDRAHAKKERE